MSERSERPNVHRPRARDDVAVEVLDGETVVFDGAAGRLYVLDRIATLVWPLLDGSATVEELAADAAAAFSAPVTEVARDLERLVGDLDRLGLLESP